MGEPVALDTPIITLLSSEPVLLFHKSKMTSNGSVVGLNPSFFSQNSIVTP
jgi:hypothetical protein